MSSEAITRNDLEAILNEIFNPLPLIDLYYPVGSYYETSDTTFNPNTAWGGTWILEIPGMVHVSGGTNYTVSKANNANGAGEKDGGNTTSATGDHKLKAAESGVPSHGHGDTFKLPNHQHHFNNKRKVPGVDNSASWASYKVSSGSTTSGYFISRGTNTFYTVVQTDDPDTNPDITGSVSNNTAADATNAHNHGNVSTMQPYININRWHRTA